MRRPATEPRAALLTGGSGGIGLAIAAALAEEGYALTLAARRPKRLADAVAGLGADGAIEPVTADVSDEEDVAHMVEHHRRARGRLDVLVNCAGTGAVQPIEAIGTRLLDKQIATNLRGLVLCTRAALPLLRAAGSEHGKTLIVNLASLSGMQGRPRIAVYGATKAAVISFSHSTMRELAGDGVRCTALAPGLVDTPMADHARDRVPGERMIRPEDLGEAVRFLLHLSDRCQVPEIAMSPPIADREAPA